MHFPKINPNFQTIYNFAGVLSASPALFLVCFGSFLFLYVPVVWLMLAHSALIIAIIIFFLLFSQLSNVP